VPTFFLSTFSIVIQLDFLELANCCKEERKMRERFYKETKERGDRERGSKQT
jgi:hypothetical protein